MCGIAGILELKGRPVDADALAAMGEVMRHRGPDGSGQRVAGSCGLIHRRLAIMDLSQRAGQPMHKCGRWIVYNGEIHNFTELRAQLEGHGYSFQTTGDTEVVLCAFDKWGLDCFERFNGMWAMALWDERSQTLNLCRDRFGIKPLYFAETDGKLLFASEVKAILTAYPALGEPRDDEVYSYLVGGNTDSDESTFYRGIKAVPPASYLTTDRKGAGKPVNYWSFEPGGIESPPHPEEELRELLRDAVRIRLRSDVQVGAFLSGGLDSSSVARFAAGLTDADIPCFSLRYSDAGDIDESHYASAVMENEERLIPHWVTPRANNLTDRIRKIVEAHDAPSPIRGRLPLWSLYEEATRHVKVVLVGDGSDEMLGGYTRFLWPYLSDRIRRDGLRFLTQAGKMKDDWNLYRGLRSSLTGTLTEMARPLVKKWSLVRLTRLDFIGNAFSKQEIGLKADRFFYTWLRKDVPSPFDDRLNNALWQEFRYVGIPESMRAGDALGMAFSVEARAPFMDHRLVEFCFKLPFSEKIGGGWTKSVLRRSLKGILPAEVLYRGDKKGLPFPSRAFLSTLDNRLEIEQLLLNGKAVSCGYLEPGGVSRLLRGVCDGSGPYSGLLVPALWRCLNLELWLRYLKRFS